MAKQQASLDVARSQEQVRFSIQDSILSTQKAVIVQAR